MFHKSKIQLTPWINWKKGSAPEWWVYYNKVKHHRMEEDKKSNKMFYKYANLKNVSEAIAGLYVVEQYYMYSYDFSKEVVVTSEMELNQYMIEDETNRLRANALGKNTSIKCCMKR